MQATNSGSNLAHFTRRMDAFSRLLDFDALRRFVAVAEHGGFRQAARELNIAQPSLSRSVQDLEHRIEARLFLRGARGVELTPVGRALLKHAQILFSDMRAAADEIASMRADVSGEIILGAVSSLTSQLLPRAIAAFSERAPAARVYVVEARADHIVQGVAAGEFELGFAPFPEDRLPHGLEAESLGHFPYAIVGAPDHPLAGGPCRLAEAAAAPWVLPEPGTILARRVESIFERAGLPFPSGLYRANAPALVTALVVRTGHLAALPRLVVEEDLASGRLAALEVEDFALQHEAGMIRRGIERAAPATRLFESTVRKVSGELGEALGRARDAKHG